MLRWITLCACLVGLLTTDSLAVEPISIPSPHPVHSSDYPIPWAFSPDKHRTRLTLLPDITPASFECSDQACKSDSGLPKTESDLIAQQRSARMPAFEIFEDPLPSPMALMHPPMCVTPGLSASTTSKGKSSRYAREYLLPAPITVSDEKPAREFPHLNLPAPLADPAAMVVQLFEKLKESEERAADAERRLAEAQQQVTSPHTFSSETHQEPVSEVVVLEMRCFEIDLDRVAAAELELAGVCKQELSRVGLFALVANGAFDQTCSCPETTSGPAESDCPFSGCAACPTQKAADGPGASAQPPSSGSGTRGQFVDDVQRLERLLEQLEEAGAIRNISRPRLMTRSGEMARMMVGREFALNTVAAAGGRAVEHTEFCTAGTNIEARPIVKAGGNVQIELHAEWSTVDEEASRKNGRPVLDRRSVSTSVELPAGKTVVVAGLMQDGVAADIAPPVDHPYGAPAPGEDRVFRKVAADPVAGAKRNEFVVLMTPKLIAPVARAATPDVHR